MIVFPQSSLSGFFIIKRKYLKNSLNKIFYGYGEFYIRLLFYMQKRGINIKEIPVQYAQRKYGTSKSRLIKMLILYICLLLPRSENV